MMHLTKTLLATCLLATLALAPAAQPLAPALTLGHSGHLQRPLAGPYGELFAGGDATAAATPVLAVETIALDGEITRALVPGTADARYESAPRLFQDPQHDAFVLLWRSQTGDADARIDFVTFDGDAWSPVLTLEQDGVPASLAGELKIAETRDAFELELAGGVSIHAARLIIHLLWRGGEGGHHTLYAPLTFVAGRYLGWHGIFPLDNLFLPAPEPDGETPPPVALTAAMARVMDLKAAADGESVVVTFANASSQRLGCLEITPLPLEIGLLGDQVREQIFALADLYDPDDVSVFADGIRAAIVIIGDRFNLHAAHAGYVADQVADWILTSGATYGWAGLENLGGDARNLAIDVTREVYVSTGADAADPDVDIVRLDVSGLFGDPQAPDPMQIFDFRTRSNLPAPAIGERPVAVFTSRQGENLLIGWQGEDDGQIYWVESGRAAEGGPWSEVFQLPLTDQLTLEAAGALLKQRIR